jgi:hypothetical protein
MSWVRASLALLEVLVAALDAVLTGLAAALVRASNAASSAFWIIEEDDDETADTDKVASSPRYSLQPPEISLLSAVRGQQFREISTLLLQLLWGVADPSRGLFISPRRAAMQASLRK